MHHNKTRLSRLAVTGAALLFVSLADTVEAIPIKLVNSHATVVPRYFVGLTSGTSLAALKKKKPGSALLVTTKAPITPVSILAISPIPAVIPAVTIPGVPVSGLSKDNASPIVPVARPLALAGSVPDGGITLVMLGGVFSGIVLIRRKLNAGAIA